jgi:hypothetical protein
MVVQIEEMSIPQSNFSNITFLIDAMKPLLVTVTDDDDSSWMTSIGGPVIFLQRETAITHQNNRTVRIWRNKAKCQPFSLTPPAAP